MNFTEMEAKVREATNNEPWGKRSMCPGLLSTDTRRRILDADAGDRECHVQLVGVDMHSS